MQQYIMYGQIVISVLIVVFILLQHKGSALGGVFGGESNIYQSKRGLEKFLHWGTIVLTVFFITASIANIII
ncbi:MAG: preprotein translocase subunit SecG [Patescibacteria group bacterium]